jgi:phosphoserine phosphatase RsbU/P
MANSSHDTESKLRESVQRYELIFKATNDVLYDLDLRRGVIEWNDVMYNRYGYKKTPATQTIEWWASRIHPDDVMRLENELNQWFAGGDDIWRSEYSFKKSDGTYANVKDRGVLQRADDGTPLRIIGTLLDITRRRQLEHAKHEFISLVSHQLRTPLTAIRIYSDMLSSGMFGNLTDIQQRYADQVSDASVRLIEQVEDVVHIARIELGQTVSHPQLVNIASLIEAVISEVSETAQKKKVKLDYRLNKQIGEVGLDEVIFKQIIRQLIINAIRYADMSVGRVAVRCSKIKEIYRISVKSYGGGMSSDVQSEVFAKFYNAQTTMMIDEHDAGLGLYSVNLLAKAVNCTLSVDNRPNDGVILSLDIPNSGMKRLD